MRGARCGENNIHLAALCFVCKATAAEPRRGPVSSVVSPSNAYSCQESSQLEHIDICICPSMCLSVNRLAMESVRCTCTHTARHSPTISGQCVSNCCLCGSRFWSSTDNDVLAITHLALQTVRGSLQRGVAGGGVQRARKKQQRFLWLMSPAHVYRGN